MKKDYLYIYKSITLAIYYLDRLISPHIDDYDAENSIGKQEQEQGVELSNE